MCLFLSLLWLIYVSIFENHNIQKDIYQKLNLEFYPREGNGNPL